MSDVVLIRFRCGVDGCGRLMAEMRPTPEEGRLLVTLKGRDVASSGGRRYGVKLDHEMLYPDPRAWPDVRVLPALALACDRHLNVGYSISASDLLEPLAQRQQRRSAVDWVPTP